MPFFNINNISTTISLKRSRRGLSVDMVDRISFKNKQPTPIPCYTYLRKVWD